MILDIKSQTALIVAYICGFVDELNGMGSKVYISQLVQNAYNMGRSDAKVGNEQVGWVERDYMDILTDIFV
jgi:hypothetical protein